LGLLCLLLFGVWGNNSFVIYSYNNRTKKYVLVAKQRPLLVVFYFTYFKV
jgi:hypothetical protein